MSQKANYKNKYSKENIEIIHSALGELSEVRRIAVHLRFWEKLTIAEVAKALGLTWVEANILLDDCVREIRAKHFPKINLGRRS